MVLLVAGCAESSPMLAREIGPPSSGWTSPAGHAECAPGDVAARLHFAKVSHLGWMSPDERVALAEADVARTRGADPEALELLALDGALRRMAPIALESAGHAAQAARLRAAPAIETRDDVEAALAIVERARREVDRPAATRLLAILEDALRQWLAGDPATRGQCEELAPPDTVEATVAAAAIRAGAPRARIANESVALLDRMARSARELRARSRRSKLSGRRAGRSSAAPSTPRADRATP